MSQPSRIEKQRTNIYTMMLIISFIALVTASVLLYLELNRFGVWPPWDTRSAVPAVGAK